MPCTLFISGVHSLRPTVGATDSDLHISRMLALHEESLRDQKIMQQELLNCLRSTNKLLQKLIERLPEDK